MDSGNTSGILPGGAPPGAMSGPGSVGPMSSIQPSYGPIGGETIDMAPDSSTQTLVLVALGLLAALWIASKG